MRGELEKQLLKQYRLIAGVDEVGRGCLAGPVYAAAVILDYQALRQLEERQLAQLRDSKTLSAKQRQEMLPVVQRIATAWAIASAEVREIEERGIVAATFLAMHRALGELKSPVDMLLIDGNKPLQGYKQPQQWVVKGDGLCYCIAAASILAKEARDSYMQALASEFPHYGFDKHVGYGTKHHLLAIQSHGICQHHRRNFAPVKTALSP